MNFNEQKLKILVVFGTRPDTIKLAPLMKLLMIDPTFDTLLCDTGQHDPEMTGPILKFFDIHGKLVRLETMIPGQSLNHIVHHVVSKIDEVITTFAPNIIVVQGDTTSAFAAALAGFNRQVPVAHVEAGLRTGSLSDPYPEEMNRIFIDRLSSMLFAPTPSAMSNIEVELMSIIPVFITGNTSVDALKYCCEKIKEKIIIPSSKIYDQSADHVLVTIHRRESFGEPLERIIKAIIKISNINPKVRFIWPVHPNPNVKDIVTSRISSLPNIVLCNPLDYMTTVFMIRTAMAVITDSGGIQEEATAFAVPTIICRNSTDRTAHDEMAASKAASFDHTLLFKGQYILAGTETEKIVEAFLKISKNINQRKKRKSSKVANSRIYSAYGDGLASKRIVAFIKEKFEMKPNEFPNPPVFSYDNWGKN